MTGPLHETAHPCRHGDVESPPIATRAAGTGDAFRAAEPAPAPNWEDWKARRETQREEEERQSQESERFWKQYEDDREARLGAYAREHHGIPRLQDDRGEGLELFINHLLPARDRVRLAEDSDRGWRSRQRSARRLSRIGRATWSRIEGRSHRFLITSICTHPTLFPSNTIYYYIA